MRILDGIFQLLTPFPQLTFEQARGIRHSGHAKPPEVRGLPYVLPYLIKGGGEAILVDCGWNTQSAYDALSDGFAEHGSKIGELTRLVITHVHPDHYGMTGRLKRETDCEVIVHERDAEVIHDRYLAPRGLIAETERFLVRHGVSSADSDRMSQGSMGMIDKVAAVPPDRTVRGGETIRAGAFEFEVLWTPGHSPGHICLYEPNHKILFSGDHILPTITPNVSIFSQTRGNPLGDYLQSLKTLESLEVRWVLPAHEFEIDYFKRRVTEIVSHHEERLDEIERCLDSGGSTAWEVAQRVRWASGPVADFEARLQRSAVGETLAHLEHLYQVGRSGKLMRDGVEVWIPRAGMAVARDGLGQSGGVNGGADNGHGGGL